MDWTKPKQTADIDIVFGGNIKELLPEMEDIPDEFKQHPGTKWNTITSQWFFGELGKDTDWIPKEGIDLTHGNYALKINTTII